MKPVIKFDDFTKLEPRTIRGVESQGMLVAAGEKEAVILSPDRDIQPGEIVR